MWPLESADSGLQHETPPVLRLVVMCSTTEGHGGRYGTRSPHQLLGLARTAAREEEGTANL